AEPDVRLVATGGRKATRSAVATLQPPQLGAPPIRNHIGSAPSTATPRRCGRVSFGDGLGGNQSRHLVLELLGDTSTPALGHCLRERLGGEVVFSPLATRGDRFCHPPWWGPWGLRPPRPPRFHRPPHTP